MSEKRYIVYLFILVSMIMLAVPLIPHHHHNDGIICMKDDVKQEADSPIHHHHHHDDPCCTSECLTQFESLAPSQYIDGVFLPHFHIVTLFTEPLIKLLNQLEIHTIRRNYVYIESLHGTFITRAAGLRAPPTLLF